MADPETGMQSGKPVVAVVMGSASDWGTMKKACDVLDRFHVPYMKKVVSAHRTPGLMAEFASSAREQGLHIIIAGAGGAAHLPGMIAAQTTLPVIGVPVRSHALSGWDSVNAGLLAVSILSVSDSRLADALADYRDSLKEKVEKSNAELV